MNKETIYERKSLITKTEMFFYSIIKELERDYKIVPQLNLASIIRKENNNYYYTDLFRNVDFAVCTKDYSKVLLLIEINDKTHSQHKRRLRDIKVRKICDSVNIKLITFYSKYLNYKSKKSIISKIKKEIESIYDLELNEEII